MSTFHFRRITAIICFAAIALIACAAPPAATPVPASTIPSTTQPTTRTSVPPTVATVATATFVPTAPLISFTFDMGRGRDGDQRPGTITLTPLGSKTQVDINLKPSPPGTQQPIHIHEGSCPGVGTIKFSLANIVEGKSTTIVDVSLKDLLTGGYAVNAHVSTVNPNTYVACGEIPKGTALTLAVGRDSDVSPVTAVLVSAGSKTDVYVSLKPSVAGVSQPVAIQPTACPGVNEVKFPLANIVLGKSKTTVDTPVDALLTGGYSINVRKSITESDVSIACGTIPKAEQVIAPAPTTDKPGAGYNGP